MAGQLGFCTMMLVWLAGVWGVGWHFSVAVVALDETAEGSGPLTSALTLVMLKANVQGGQKVCISNELRLVAFLQES